MSEHALTVTASLSSGPKMVAWLCVTCGREGWQELWTGATYEDAIAAARKQHDEEEVSDEDQGGTDEGPGEVPGPDEAVQGEDLPDPAGGLRSPVGQEQLHDHDARAAAAPGEGPGGADGRTDEEK